MKPVCPTCGSVSVKVGKDKKTGECQNSNCADKGRVRTLRAFRHQGESVLDESYYPILQGGYRRCPIRYDDSD